MAEPVYVGVLNEHDRFPLAWAVDNFLDAGRRAENALTRYIARTFGAQVPLSLHDFVADSAKHTRKVPEQVLELVTDYWRKHGHTLKDYRDLAQHFAIVSSDVYVHVDPTSQPRVHLLLPVEPADKALKRLSYGPPYVHAGEWCREAFLALFEVAYGLQWLLLRHFEYSLRAMRMLNRHPISLNARDAFSDPPREDLDELLWQTRERLRPSLEAQYGKLEDPPLAGAVPKQQ